MRAPRRCAGSRRAGRAGYEKNARIRWYIVLPLASTTCTGSYEPCPTSASKRAWRIDNALLIHGYLDMGSWGRYCLCVCCGRHGCAQSPGSGPAQQQGPRSQSLIPPRSCTSVKRAFALLYQGVAKAVDEQYHTFDFESWRDLSIEVQHERLGLVNGFIRVPRVLLLTAYERVPKRHVRFSRFNIFARDGNTCQYCHKNCRAPS